MQTVKMYLKPVLLVEFQDMHEILMKYYEIL